MCGFRNRNYNIYNGALIENRSKINKKANDNIEDVNISNFGGENYISFIFERCRKKNNYVTKNNQKRTGYVLKEKFEYDVICKVEL